MSKEVIETGVEVAGKTYYIKCPRSESASLIRAAEYLNSQLRVIRETNQIINFDRLIIITALNIVHELLLNKDKHDQEMSTVNQHVSDIQTRIEQALMQDAQMELYPAD